MENNINEEYNLKVDDESRQIISQLMNDDSFRIPAHISLQEVNISLYQLIELEKGYEIAFNLQQDSTVKLFIAGEVIALASISIDKEKIKLKIIETFLKNNSDISDNTMSLQN